MRQILNSSAKRSIVLLLSSKRTVETVASLGFFAAFQNSLSASKKNYSYPQPNKLFCRKLDDIVKIIDNKSSHGTLTRFAEGKKDKGDITTFAGAISDLISNLQVRSASNFLNIH